MFTYYALTAVPLIIFAVIVAFLITTYARTRVAWTLKQTLRIKTKSRRIGADLARELIQNSSLSEVNVDMTNYWLLNYYDPGTRTIYLSPEIYSNNSIASLVIAAHEVSHAIQHREGHLLLTLRRVLLMPLNILLLFAFASFFLGLISFNLIIFVVGAVLFAIVLLAHGFFFLLLTLPVEFDANAKALSMLKKGGYLTEDETKKGIDILKASTLSYLALPGITLLQLLRKHKTG